MIVRFIETILPIRNWNISAVTIAGSAERKPSYL